MIPPLVLYAEDDENHALLMQRAFGKLGQGSALRIVRDGREAVDYLAGNGEFADRTAHPAPTLVLLDVRMPGMSGLDVLRWFRESPDRGGVPVVMFTSSTQDSDLAFSRDHGANAYLVKPANIDHLAALIDDLLSAASHLPAPRTPLDVRGNKMAGTGGPAGSANARRSE